MKKVGLWMYKNDGGDIIQERLKSKLIKNNIFVLNDFDLRDCYIVNDKILTSNGYDLTKLDCLYYMNADGNISWRY